MAKSKKRRSYRRRRRSFAPPQTDARAATSTPFEVITARLKSVSMDVGEAISRAEEIERHLGLTVGEPKDAGSNPGEPADIASWCANLEVRIHSLNAILSRLMP